MMIEAMLDIILVEDNPSDIELTLDALQENKLADRVMVLKDSQEAVNCIFRLVAIPAKDMEFGALLCGEPGDHFS